MTLNNCLFEENGKGSATGPDVISVFGGATVEINSSKFLNNVNRHTIACFNGDVEVTESHFEGNARSVYYSKKNGDAKFTDCKFINNTNNSKSETFYLEKGSFAEFDNCELGDSTFNDASRVSIVNSARAKRFGSMFGEGSLAMIVSLLAIITSGVCIFLVVDMKKKLVPVAANGAAKIEDEEE